MPKITNLTLTPVDINTVRTRGIYDEAVREFSEGAYDAVLVEAQGVLGATLRHSLNRAVQAQNLTERVRVVQQEGRTYLVRA